MSNKRRCVRSIVLYSDLLWVVFYWFVYLCIVPFGITTNWSVWKLIPVFIAPLTELTARRMACTPEQSVATAGSQLCRYMATICKNSFPQITLVVAEDCSTFANYWRWLSHAIGSNNSYVVITYATQLRTMPSTFFVFLNESFKLALGGRVARRSSRKRLITFRF